MWGPFLSAPSCDRFIPDDAAPPEPAAEDVVEELPPPPPEVPGPPLIGIPASLRLPPADANVAHRVVCADHLRTA